MEVKGVKEIKELVDGLALLYKVGKAVAADGKVDFSDVSVLLKFQSELSVLVAAADGVAQVGAEVKDLSGEEALELLAYLFSKVKEA